IVFPATEMGQGSSTALPVILAEELDTNWDDVVVEQLDRDDRTYGNPLFGNVLYTAGSTAVYGYFEPLRRAGAQARDVLLQIAARRLDVSRDALRTEPSVVVAPDGSRLSYGELAALGVNGMTIPQAQSVPLKATSDFRLIGHDVPRKDVPAKSTGQEAYAIDVAVPNMAYASVFRAPVEGETPVRVDDEAARAVAGVIDIVTLPDGLAVVAETFHAALAGRNALDVEWTQTSPARAFDSEATLADYAAAAAGPNDEVAVWSERGDAVAAIDDADRTVFADYLSDYAYHAQMEPMAAVARIDADGLGAEVWAGTQTQTWTTRTVTEVLGTTPDRVRLHMMTMGGSFGRRTALRQEYVRDALLAAKAVGRPVKVVWTREDDLQHGWFRPAAAQRMTAGLTADGKLVGWHHRVATPSVIAYFNPLRWEMVEPNDIVSMRGAESKFYAIADFRADHVITERRAHLAPYRGIGASYTSFAAEAFMDELAEAASEDPVAFRMALLRDDPRGRALLERVVEMSGWTERGDRALGLAFAGYGDSRAAGVAEVTIDRERGWLRVPRFWAAVDAGLIVSPDNAHAQIEGGILFGLSSALMERVVIENGIVQQSNFFDYPILRADEVPEIDIHIAAVDAAPTGIGEVGTPMTAAAVANAFHAATGRRLRHMPFTPDRVLAALA
ncbi:MAG: molybdopterin cofactor-binding domain-containing protein, partial [Pseudomonadota bacterium]